MAQEEVNRLQETVESLKGQNTQLIRQLNVCYQRMQDMDMSNTFRRLDYLFKVVENSLHFSEEFVEKCVQEIMSLMTIPEQSQNVPEDANQKE